VTVAGQTAVTDAEGRFSFYGIAPGTYPVVAQLPNGLTAQIGPVIVSEGRGAVVRVTAAKSSGFNIYLPVMIRP
jgi:protocatechuate 3,4-dioxygenase beta subunit